MSKIQGRIGNSPIVDFSYEEWQAISEYAQNIVDVTTQSAMIAPHVSAMQLDGATQVEAYVRQYNDERERFRACGDHQHRTDAEMDAMVDAMVTNRIAAVVELLAEESAGGFDPDKWERVGVDQTVSFTLEEVENALAAKAGWQSAGGGGDADCWLLTMLASEASGLGSEDVGVAWAKFEMLCEASVLAREGITFTTA